MKTELRGMFRDMSIILVCVYFIASSFNLLAHSTSHARVAHAATGINTTVAVVMLLFVALVELTCCAALVFSEVCTHLGLIFPSAVLAIASFGEAALYGELMQTECILKISLLCFALFANTLSLYVEAAALAYHGVPMVDSQLCVSSAMRKVATRVKAAHWLPLVAAAVFVHALFFCTFWAHRGAMRSLLYSQFLSELNTCSFLLSLSGYDHTGSWWKFGRPFADPKHF